MVAEFVDAPVTDPGAECWHHDDGETLLEFDEPQVNGRMYAVTATCAGCGADLVLEVALTQFERGRCRAVTGKGRRCPNDAAFHSEHQLCGLHTHTDSVRLVDADLEAEGADDER